MWVWVQRCIELSRQRLWIDVSNFNSAFEQETFLLFIRLKGHHFNIVFCMLSHSFQSISQGNCPLLERYCLHGLVHHCHTINLQILCAQLTYTEGSKSRCFQLFLLSRGHLLNSMLLIWLTADHEHDTFILQK